MLVRHLPPGSATAHAQESPAEWGHTEHLLADVRELLRAANWQRGGDKKRPRPKPIPRPGEAKAHRAAMRAKFDRLMEQRRRLGR